MSVGYTLNLAFIGKNRGGAELLLCMCIAPLTLLLKFTFRSRFAGQLTIYLRLLDFQFGVHYLKRGGVPSCCYVWQSPFKSIINMQLAHADTEKYVFTLLVRMAMRWLPK